MNKGNSGQNGVNEKGKTMADVADVENSCWLQVLTVLSGYCPCPAID